MLSIYKPFIIYAECDKILNIMPVLLEFSVNNEKYGVIKADRNEANHYINQVTQLLREQRALKSLLPQGSGYKYSLINNTEIFVSISNLNNAIYQIDVFSDDSFIKSYKTKNYQQAATIMLDNRQYNTYLYAIIDKNRPPLACVDVLNGLRDGTIAKIYNVKSTKPDWLLQNPEAKSLAILFAAFIVITELSVIVLGLSMNIWWLMVAVLLLSIVLKYTAWRGWSTNRLYKIALLPPAILTAVATGIADLYVASRASLGAFASIISATVDVSIIVLLYIIASTDFKSLEKR